MAHLTDLGFTMDMLNKSIEDGEVRVQTHPEFPSLSIANYTEEVQYRNKWNEITLSCRGLIFDSVTGEVVARPWKKFFNLGQMPNRIDSDAPVEVTDKLDGSLGILYRRPDGDWAIATRGSFTSEQAIHGTGILARHSKEYWDGVQTGGYTYLFEIIYPDNRIVVDYGDMDDLVLLGAVYKERGRYIGPTVASAYLGWDGPVAETFSAPNFVSAISLPDRRGKEGYIIRSGSKIVKLKQQDYIELHRIVTNLSPKTIWEMIGDGKTVADICAGIPDEFHSYVENIGNELLIRASDIQYQAKRDLMEVSIKLQSRGTRPSRRDYAEAIKTKRNPGLLFGLLDERDIRPVVWKMVKPRGDIKTLVEDNG